MNVDRNGNRQNPRSPLEALNPAALVRKSSLIYGVMILIGLAGMTLGHGNLVTALAVPKAPAEVLRLGGIGVFSAGFLLVLSYFFEDWFASFRELKTLMTRVLGPCSALTTVYLSVITAFGEEMLFRGAIQPAAGLAITAILFGLLHMGGTRLISAWSVWALIAGGLLGWTFEETGSLWPAVIAHFGVNLYSIMNLRRAWRGYPAHRRTWPGRPDGRTADPAAEGQRDTDP